MNSAMSHTNLNTGQALNSLQPGTGVDTVLQQCYLTRITMLRGKSFPKAFHLETVSCLSNHPSGGIRVLYYLYYNQEPIKDW